jgi:hypothetical protein
MSSQNPSPNENVVVGIRRGDEHGPEVGKRRKDLKMTVERVPIDAGWRTKPPSLTSSGKSAIGSGDLFNVSL